MLEVERRIEALHDLPFQVAQRVSVFDDHRHDPEVLVHPCGQLVAHQYPLEGGVENAAKSLAEGGPTTSTPEMLAA